MIEIPATRMVRMMAARERSRKRGTSRHPTVSTITRIERLPARASSSVHPAPPSVTGCAIEAEVRSARVRVIEDPTDLRAGLTEMSTVGSLRGHVTTNTRVIDTNRDAPTREVDALTQVTRSHIRSEEEQVGAREGNPVSEGDARAQPEETGAPRCTARDPRLIPSTEPGASPPRNIVEIADIVGDRRGLAQEGATAPPLLCLHAVVCT